MRRSDREISDPRQIDYILQRGTVCRLAMCSSDRPYVVPLCYGFKGHSLYFHSAASGKKTAILKENHEVCFEVTIEQRLQPARAACKWGMHYQSVIGYGKVSFILDPPAKKRALDIILAHYGDLPPSYSDAALEKTMVFKVDVAKMTGKQSP